MKLKNIAKYTAIFLVVLAAVSASVFCALGVPEQDTAPIVAVTEEVPQVVTEAEPIVPEETQAPVTSPPTQAPETTKATKATKPENNQAVVETQPATKATYATTQPVTHSLPKATVETAPTAISVDKEKDGDLTYGYASWACVIVGVLVVVIVLISNKTQYHRGDGKHRYDEGNKITGQKRLLNDDYYNHRKTESYYSKDKRR